MSDEHDAVILLLERLKTEGLNWYRNAKTSDVDMFERRISGNFSIFEGGEIHTIGRKPTGSFPSKKILIMPPSGREDEAILGLWLKWDFAANPFEFRLFPGQWSEIGGIKTFIAFRIEAPETGDQHRTDRMRPGHRHPKWESCLSVSGDAKLMAERTQGGDGCRKRMPRLGTFQPF